MTIHEYLMKANQDDARRAGERGRLLREARRTRRARRRKARTAAWNSVPPPDERTTLTLSESCGGLSGAG